MPDTLLPDQQLNPGQSLQSSDGRSCLTMQGDGNLVLGEPWHGRDVATWTSGTPGNDGATVVMQGDGNLVVYRPDGSPVWDSGTWGNPGSRVVLQSDGNLVVYAADDGPLWASDTQRFKRKLGFEPAVHGFHHNNQFTNRVATIPGWGPIETHGRCGGMAYAALDYYFAGVPIPGYTSAQFSPLSVPPDGHWLADYIYQRLMHSFFTPSAVRFPEWTVHSDHSTWFFKGVTHWTKHEQFPLLRQRIDEGGPVVLGLVGATNLGDVGNRNHQVVAYGYEWHTAGLMTVYVYDNNSPEQEVTLTSSADNPHFEASNGSPWRGFFVHAYEHVNPPVFTAQPAPRNRPVRYGDTIKVGHVWTGRSLHSHDLVYGHPEGSGQQQVTAFEGADDNDLWRVKGPDGTPDDHRLAEPVASGDVIRLEHVATRRNLHSHGGIPSPVTSQQEVSCFGDNGAGDANDNWRVEMAGHDWRAGGRLRLIHEATNRTLHSHSGHAHSAWTAGQQEVTCFDGRDDNDWWSLLELR